jgi:predicted amino acid racemase
MTVTLTLDVAAVRHNVLTVRTWLAAQHIDVLGVTKAVDSEPDVGRAMLAGGAVALADSRLSGIERLARHGLGPRVLIRPPQLDEVGRAVRSCDGVFVSDVDTAAALSARAGDTRLGVFLIVDIGDRRDGVLPEDAARTARTLASMRGVAVAGIAVNFACLSGLQPQLRLFQEADTLVDAVAPWCATEPSLSLGGTYCLPHLIGAFEPRHRCSIRLGAGLYFGHYTLPGVSPPPGLMRADPVLTATVLECRRKPGPPPGTIGVDSFGRSPDTRLPAESAYHVLLAMGRRESEPRCLHPFLQGSYVAGMSSDHTLLISDRPLRAGDTVDFALDYEGLVRAHTSPFVSRVYLESDFSSLQRGRGATAACAGAGGGEMFIRSPAAAVAVPDGTEVLRIRAPQPREHLVVLDEAAPLS